MDGIEAEYLTRVRDGMYGVCNEPGGTAVRAGAVELVRHPETGAATPLTTENRGWLPVQIAGKTGTAQVRALGANRGRHFSTIEWKYRDNALFCCFGPWHEPRYACAVIVEHGGAGSAVAGPIAKDTQGVLDPDWATLKMLDALPRDAILVFESLTTGRHVVDLYPFRDRFGYHGLASGGIGFSIPASVGIALAQPKRRVVTTVGDGSAMYSIQALWTAAHHKLPITYVVCNNGGYRIIKQRLLAFHGNRNFIGMGFEDPPMDYAQMAAAMGVRSERITTPEALGPAMQRALKHDGPVLLDLVVDGRV